MTAFEIIPFILFLVVIGTAIAERINVPYPLILVVAGLVAGFVPGIPNWHPPSDIVLLLFLPPILFAAARLVSWEDVTSSLTEIGFLSILLVLVTAFAIAWILYHIVPGMPFGAALILGAIISPTDAVASTSMLSKMNANPQLIRSIEIESLFNDAISIVLYQVAVMLLFVGTIDFQKLTVHPVAVGVGGIAVGLVFAYFTSLIVNEFLTESENELPIIMSLILAYVSYLFADRIGVSGVLAVVAAGLYHRRTERVIQARTRLSEKSVWSTLIFFLNGLIFIVIGLQFPIYLKKVSRFPLHELVWLSIITIATITLLRFIFVMLAAYFNVLIAALRKSTKPARKIVWSNVLISSWSGMRGLVSLALAIALPTTLSHTQPFPFRNLIIFLTIITILFSLLVEGLTLPYLVKWLKAEKSEGPMLKKTAVIYQKLTTQAIEHISKLSTKKQICSLAARRLVDNYYANRLLQFKLSYDTKRDQHEVGLEAIKLLVKILEYERSVLHKMLENGEISQEIYLRILQKIDRDEVGFESYR